jgi:hypothetical protein
MDHKIAFWCLKCRAWTTIKISEDAYTNYNETGDGRSLRSLKSEDVHLITNGYHEEC